MQTSSVIAALLVPTVGAGFWWLVQQPGKSISERLDKRLKNGWLRKILLKRIT